MASSDSSEPDVEELINDLAPDAKSLKIQSNESGAKVYYVPKTFLAGVSTTLAEHCRQQRSELDISQEALHIFLVWLISRDLGSVTINQESLAQAWNFGAEYDISDFQDAIMHRLVTCLRQEDVDPDAVIEAYAADERDTKLQRAFIAQLAIDMRREDEYSWARTTFTENCLEDVPGFYLDLTEAMCGAKHGDKLVIGDFLVKQQDDTE